MTLRVFALIFAVCAFVAAQGRPDASAHKAAMEKLKFLEGSWSGDATVTLGPGRQMKIRQTEEIAYKLGGVVLLIEGTGRDEAGKVVFNALATIAWEGKAGGYRIRAYRDANYVDAPLKVAGNGFEWSFETGPVTVSNRMSLDEKGRWSETTRVRAADGREFESVQMLLNRVNPPAAQK